MFKRWTWLSSLMPDDVFRRPWEWTPVSAAEASSQSRWAPIVVVSRSPTGEQAAWYDDHNAFFRGSGPPAHRALRYYQYIGGVPQPAAAFHAVTEAEPEEPELEEEPVPSPPPAEEPTSWVEVELVDRYDRPVEGERVEIELPDGSIAEARTDGNGLVRLDGIDPGTCQITFPDFDAREWRRI